MAADDGSNGTTQIPADDRARARSDASGRTEPAMALFALTCPVAVPAIA
jgi:hypothetical protein